MGMTAVRAAGYDADLERIENDIAELASLAFVSPARSETVTKYLYRLYQRVSLNGRLEELRSVEAEIDRAIEQLGPAEDLCLLKANLNFKLHRLAETQRALALAPALRYRAEGRGLLADIDFQYGRIREAEKAVKGLIEEERTWDNLARLAHMRLKWGDFDGANRLYLEAEDELTAKEMRSYAWVEVQRGLANMMRGEYERAGAHFVVADKAYPGFWLIQEHTAGLRAAQGDAAGAVTLYEEVLRRNRKPEVLQKVGEMHEELGEFRRAGTFFDEALAIYLESTQRGEVHYYHHLVEFYATARVDAAECLQWARKDLALRGNFATQSAYAWALYLNGSFIEAAEVIAVALASGVKDGDIFSKAAMIYDAVGSRGKAHLWEHRAGRINPRARRFHVHV